MKPSFFYHLSAMGRPLAFRYPSNVFAALISGVGLAAGVGVGVMEDKAPLPLLWMGLVTSVTVFVAWALARELDPDYAASAGLAAVLALAGMIFWRETTNLLALYLMLVMARVLVRTVGIPMTLLDMGLLVIGAGLVALTESWLLGLVTAGALLLDSLLQTPNPPTRLFGGLAALVTMLAAAFAQPDFSPPDDGIMLSVAAVFGLLFLTVTLTDSAPVSVGDITGQRLEASRLKAGRLLVLAGAVLVCLWAGSMLTLLPFWCVFLAVSVIRMFQKVGFHQAVSS
ncbi:MAG: hypothetical protein K8I82_02330 [Anaerolineae bacterium]|nr:hypothetical protein [Anaerolineae bacterium]